jgi:hypothetical protein
MRGVSSSEYNDGGQARNGGDNRTGSFQSTRGHSVRNGRSIMDAKKQRKDIERDAQLLANRIALLK